MTIKVAWLGTRFWCKDKLTSWVLIWVSALALRYYVLSDCIFDPCFTTSKKSDLIFMFFFCLRNEMAFTTTITFTHTHTQFNWRYSPSCHARVDCSRRWLCCGSCCWFLERHFRWDPLLLCCLFSMHPPALLLWWQLIAWLDNSLDLIPQSWRQCSTPCQSSATVTPYPRSQEKRTLRVGTRLSRGLLDGWSSVELFIGDQFCILYIFEIYQNILISTPMVAVTVLSPSLKISLLETRCLLSLKSQYWHSNNNMTTRNNPPLWHYFEGNHYGRSSAVLKRCAGFLKNQDR